MKRQHRAAVALVMVVLLAAGCSARQAYYGGQAWQRNECNRMIDATERDHCLRGTETRYEDYERERKQTRTP